MIFNLENKKKSIFNNRKWLMMSASLLVFFKALNEDDCTVCNEINKMIAPDYFIDQFERPIYMMFLSPGHPEFYKHDYYVSKNFSRLAAIRRFMKDYKYKVMIHDDDSGIIHHTFFYQRAPDGVHPDILICPQDLSVVSRQLDLAREVEEHFFLNKIDQIFEYFDFIENHISFWHIFFVTATLLVILWYFKYKNIVIHEKLINLFQCVLGRTYLLVSSLRRRFNEKCNKIIYYCKEEWPYFKKRYFLWKSSWVIKRAVVRFFGKIILYLKKKGFFFKKD